MCAPYATPATVRTAVPKPIKGIIASCTILIDAVYAATASVPDAITSILFMIIARAENTRVSNVEGTATCNVSIINLDE